MKTIGDKGEERARHFIEQKYGWQLLDKNWRSNRGEVDAIYYDKVEEVVHFNEVKQRKMSLDRALESVTKRKLEKLRLTARSWLAQRNYNDVQCQFDVVVLSDDSIEMRQDILH